MASELVERLRQIRLDAVLAIEDADYDTAYSKLLAAKVIMDTAPSRWEKDGLELEFRDFEPLMKRLELERGRLAASGKLKRIPIEHVSAQYGWPGYDPYWNYPW